MFASCSVVYFLTRPLLRKEPRPTLSCVPRELCCVPNYGVGRASRRGSVYVVFGGVCVLTRPLLRKEPRPTPSGVSCELCCVPNYGVGRASRRGRVVTNNKSHQSYPGISSRLPVELTLRAVGYCLHNPIFQNNCWHCVKCGRRSLVANGVEQPLCL